ncbi:hypothetical protein FB45DRAFT_920906 [Roridomyces roridus]|uniref:RRM domain-containing protein n=1 Tax=Roridomyces roridus TaxID=1738132 RepID=A0AAD7BPZ2_9AGAR|nr:hypothetical protein FB45DRAFT_920906 [Roridomyces roridus]
MDTQTQERKEHKGKQRVVEPDTGPTPADLLKAVGVSFQKKLAKARAAGPAQRLAEPWVAVGHLDPETTETELRAHFTHAGAVRSVTIRYSSGTVDERVRTEGYRYAMIVFRDCGVAHDALLLSGSRVGASTYRIAVVSTLADLPEIRALAKAAVTASRNSAAASASTDAKPLTAEKTKLWLHRPDIRNQLALQAEKGKRVYELHGVEFTLETE